MLQHILRGRGSAGVLLLNCMPFLRVSHLCNLPCCVHTFFRFVSIPRFVLMLQVLALWRRRLKHSANILLTCILYCDAAGDAGPGYLIGTVCKHSALLEYHIYRRPALLQRLP